MMSSNAYEKEQAIAMQAVRAAARLCRAVQARISPEVLSKKDRSPVTVADFGSQALVCRVLREAFPNDPVIAEENSAALRLAENAQLLDKVVAHVQEEQDGAGADEICAWIDHGGAKDYADRFWTLDPIDGTKGFLRAEQYAVALALVVDGQVTVAALACPNLPITPGSEERGVAYLAVRGRGAVAVPLVATSGTTPRKR
jgi:3'(2'), 5'-bisphosphate nucleotidase